MEPLRLTTLNDARLRVFSHMTDAELRDPRQLIGLVRATGDARANQGIFIAESRNVIDRAIVAGCQPFALVSEQRWIAQVHEICSEIEARYPNASFSAFVSTREHIQELTGMKTTRGPLAAFMRPKPNNPADLLTHARCVAVLEDLTNYTNLGAIFRSAAALGIDAVLLTPGCHDPLYRRAARVSMGTVFQVPWAYMSSEPSWTNEGIDVLHRAGFTVIALALEHDSLRLQSPEIATAQRIALVLGTEGTGLRAETIEACDHTVRIPMAHGVDSLNVGAAAAIAFWEFCGRQLP